MNLRILPVVRWFIMFLLLACVLWWGYCFSSFAIDRVGRISSYGVLTAIDVPLLLLGALFFAWVIAIPGIMLYSVAVKRLRPFASSIGLIVGLGLFWAVIILQSKLGVMEVWESDRHFSGPVHASLGLVLSLGHVIIPLWVLYRVMRLSKDWLYPKVLQPLESKI